MENRGYLHLPDGKASVKQGEESPAECTLIMSLDSFKQFLVGKLNGTVAFMTGKTVFTNINKKVSEKE